MNPEPDTDHADLVCPGCGDVFRIKFEPPNEGAEGVSSLMEKASRHIAEEFAELRRLVPETDPGDPDWHEGGEAMSPAERAFDDELRALAKLIRDCDAEGHALAPSRLLPDGVQYCQFCGSQKEKEGI